MEIKKTLLTIQLKPKFSLPQPKSYSKTKAIRQPQNCRTLPHQSLLTPQHLHLDYYQHSLVIVSTNQNESDFISFCSLTIRPFLTQTNFVQVMFMCPFQILLCKDLQQDGSQKIQNKTCRLDELGNKETKKTFPRYGSRQNPTFPLLETQFPHILHQYCQDSQEAFRQPTTIKCLVRFQTLKVREQVDQVVGIYSCQFCLF